MFFKKKEDDMIEIKRDKDYYGRIKGYKVLLITDPHSVPYSFKKPNEYFAYVGDLYVAKELGLTMCDKGEYDGVVSSEDVECIWTEEEDGTIINVLKGVLIVKEGKKLNPSIFSSHRKYYAIYRGRKCFVRQGQCGREKLTIYSYDYYSQEEGFIMTVPGCFEKRVNVKDIDIMYTSEVFCSYKGYKFCISEGTDESFWIEPYSRSSHMYELLDLLGFITRNDKPMKFVNIQDEDVNMIWIENEAEDRYKNMELKNKILKEPKGGYKYYGIYKGERVPVVSQDNDNLYCLVGFYSKYYKDFKNEVNIQEKCWIDEFDLTYKNYAFNSNVIVTIPAKRFSKLFVQKK